MTDEPVTLETLMPPLTLLRQELLWDAPWVDVCLRVELPFWLVVDNTTIPIEVGGHAFPGAVHGENV
jgi:hypothetical protein